jgi:hypothetical protein
LHTFYTKEGDDDVTHTSTAFTTTAHRNSGNAFDGVKTIEIKLGKENLNVIVDFGITFGDYGVSTRFPNGVISGSCDLGPVMIVLVLLFVFSILFLLIGV